MSDIQTDAQYRVQTVDGASRITNLCFAGQCQIADSAADVVGRVRS